MPTSPWDGMSREACALAMIAAFSATGGVVNAEEFCCLLRRHVPQPISLVARWIVGRDVVSFGWHRQTMLPLFQFDLSCGAMRPGILRIVSELRAAFDDWELAAWFAQPNAWLHGEPPLMCLSSDLDPVFDAARADRFVAMG